MRHRSLYWWTGDLFSATIFGHYQLSLSMERSAGGDRESEVQDTIFLFHIHSRILGRHALLFAATYS